MTPSSIIAPDAISPPKAPGQPPQPFTPPAFGVGLPYDEDDAKRRNERGLQEARIERDAWKGILDALMKLKKARDEERKGRLTKGERACTHGRTSTVRLGHFTDRSESRTNRMIDDRSRSQT